MTPPQPPRTEAAKRLMFVLAGLDRILARPPAEMGPVSPVVAEFLPSIEAEAAGAALAALRAEVRWLNPMMRGDEAVKAVAWLRTEILAVIDRLSGAAPAAGEVARIGFPGQPFGYATGGNEPAAPAAPLVDVERLAKALQAIEHGTPTHFARGGIVPWEELQEHAHERLRRDAAAVAAAYARLANPEKP